MQYEIDVDIDASAEQIWTTLTDVEQWPAWNGSTARAERVGDGEFGAGSAARVKQPWLPATVWTVTEYEPGKYFSWMAENPGVTTVGTHDLVTGTDGSVNVRLTIQHSGLLAPLVWLLLSRLNRRYVDMEAQGLKRHCES